MKLVAVGTFNLQMFAVVSVFFRSNPPTAACFDRLTYLIRRYYHASALRAAVFRLFKAMQRNFPLVTTRPTSPLQQINLTDISVAKAVSIALVTLYSCMLNRKLWPAAHYPILLWPNRLTSNI